MRILIANDDGVNAPGLAALHEVLCDIADCTVMAPEQDRSGASSSLTLNRPLHPQQLPNGFISVEHTNRLRAPGFEWLFGTADGHGGGRYQSWGQPG